MGIRIVVVVVVVIRNLFYINVRYFIMISNCEIVVNEVEKCSYEFLNI